MEFIEHFEMLKPEIKQHTNVRILNSHLDAKEEEFFKGHSAVLDYIVKSMMVKKFNAIE